MDLQYLKELLAIFDASSATDLMIEEDGCSVSLSRRPTEPTHVYGSFPQQVPIQTPHIQAPVHSAPVEAPVAAVSANTHSILSPIVGTFYNAPNPDSPPYVSVGDHITVGQKLCIVEAMKLMNEIESDVSGTIIKVIPNNAQPVEYDQPLFIIQLD